VISAATGAGVEPLIYAIYSPIRDARNSEAKKIVTVAGSVTKSVLPDDLSIRK
jgi:hypothetical protein